MRSQQFIGILVFRSIKAIFQMFTVFSIRSRFSDPTDISGIFKRVIKIALLSSFLFSNNVMEAFWLILRILKTAAWLNLSQFMIDESILYISLNVFSPSQFGTL